MDRDHGPASFMPGSEDTRSRKGRLMGKLFGGRDRKVSNELRGDDADINAFLHGTSSPARSPRLNAPSSSPSPATAPPSFDTFQVAHSAPPQLAKLDTRAASRYPNALPVDYLNSSQQSLPSSQRSHSPPSTYSSSRPSRRNRRGLVVRFADTYPEIIGEGGDETETPPIEISRRRRARAAKPQALPLHSMQNMGRGPPIDAQSMAMPMRSPLPGPSSILQQSQLESQQPPPQVQPALRPRQQQQQQQQQQQHQRLANDDDAFVPRPLRRTQTGYSTISDLSSPEDENAPPLPSPPSLPSSPERNPAVPAKIPASRLAPAPFLDSPVLKRDDSRRSFIETHQAEMREAEGRALANALRAGVSPPSSPEVEEKKPPSPRKRSPAKKTQAPLPPPRHPDHRIPNKRFEFEPSASSPERTRSERYKQLAESHSSPSDSPPTSAVERPYNAFRRDVSGSLSMKDRGGYSAGHSKIPVQDIRDTAQSAADEAFVLFVSRMRHLFELFRLHSETVKPLSASTAVDLARAALWWFVIGRMALENVMRERSAAGGGGAQLSRGSEFAMQQAYADLAKSYWVLEEVLPDILARKQSPADAEVGQVRAVLISNLRKLSTSMKRNDLLPPEDALLPQTIDKAIWAVYPPVSSDVTALLWGLWGSSLAASASPVSPMSILESMPVSDSGQDFVFSRIWADVYLAEQGRESASYQQRLHFPCILTVARPQDTPTLEAIIASQNGAVQLRLRGKKNSGPTWDDVRWRPDSFALEMKMPRGFLLVIQLSKSDYGLLWSMYEFGGKVHSQLYPRKDEHAMFRTTLKAFQYFESGTPSGSFPKEAVADCEAALFEKIVSENAATGRRNFHRGFRLAVVSGTRTRTLYGASQLYLPEVPVQFSFLRGDHGDPALLLRFENSRSKGSMVLSFAAEEERTRFHMLLADTALQSSERIVVDVPVSSLQVLGASMTAPISGKVGGGSAGQLSNAYSVFKKLSFNRLRVLNYDDEADATSAATVLAESLRVIMEFGDCTLTDRINVAPGELKLRLDVRDNTCLALLRQPQKDVTVAVSDVQVPREMSRELGEGLRAMGTGATCRMLRFPTVTDLHAVQLAITGYQVVFDGMAATFAIARRRMVVPIHKKWEAGTTRIQVVVQPDTKVTQLLAFFQDFHYGRCMSLVLKGTDVFEAFSRGSKAGLKIDDAKFPLPRMPTGESGAASGQEGGIECDETAFVCLDMPDLPGEHDDISILFEKEAERDRLATCLPAPVRSSRLGKKF